MNIIYITLMSKNGNIRHNKTTMRKILLIFISVWLPTMLFATKPNASKPEQFHLDQ